MTQLYDLKYINSKRVPEYLRLFNTYNAPKEYQANIIIRNYKIEYDNGRIRKCAYNMKDFDTVDKLYVLAVSFLWYTHQNIGVNRLSYLSIRQLLNFKYFYWFTDVPGVLTKFDIFCLEGDDLVALLLIFINCKKWVMNMPLLFQIIKIFTHDAPFNATDSMQRWESPLSIDDIHDIIITSKRHITLYMDEIFAAREQIQIEYHRDKQSKDLEDLLVAFGYNSANIEFIRYGTSKPINSIIDLLSLLHRHTEFNTAIGISLSHNMEIPRMIMINGCTYCSGCWLWSKTYYHHLGCFKCKVHLPNVTMQHVNVLDNRIRTPNGGVVEIDQQIITSKGNDGDNDINNDNNTNVISSNSNVLCPICLEKEKNIAFTSCGHLVCSQCSKLVSVCPVCRKTISGRLSVYI